MSCFDVSIIWAARNAKLYSILFYMPPLWGQQRVDGLRVFDSFLFFAILRALSMCWSGTSPERHSAVCLVHCGNTWRTFGPSSMRRMCLSPFQLGSSRVAWCRSRALEPRRGLVCQISWKAFRIPLRSTYVVLPGIASVAADRSRVYYSSSRGARARCSTPSTSPEVLDFQSRWRWESLSHPWKCETAMIRWKELERRHCSPSALPEAYAYIALCSANKWKVLKQILM